MYTSPKKSIARTSSFVLHPRGIDIQPVDLAKPLGKGGFGIVYKGSYQLAPAAIKELLVPNLSARELIEFTQEAEIMAGLHHPNIIQLYGFTGTAPYRMVMELMPNGSLYDVLRSGDPVDWPQRVSWAIDIGAGLHYLHTRQPQIIHRDLKSLNVLMSRNNEAKLTDFGLALAKLRTTTATLTSSAKGKQAVEPTGAVGSTRWMAPELFSELEPTYNQATDMFSYAVVLWEIAAREIPYPNVRADSIIEDAIQKGKRATIQPDWRDSFKTLMALCWDQSPNKRLSAQKAVERLKADLVALSQTPVEKCEDLRIADSTPVSRGYALESDKPIANSGYQLASNKPVPAKRALTRPSQPQKIHVVEHADTGGYGDSAVHTQANTFNPEGKESMVHSHRMFKAPAPSFNQSEVNEFLNNVALGAQNKAEAMLKKTPGLVLGKGTCTDQAGRTFKEISGFQYALWALDWHMWDMILAYFDQVPEGKTSASEQCGSQERLSQQCGHGAHYSMQPLLNALQTYIDQYPALSKVAFSDSIFTSKKSKEKNQDQMQRLWIHGVGKAQAQTVAHVAQEYCHPDRPFNPVPDFNAKPFKREFNTDEGEWWTARYNNGKLGGNGVSYTGDGFARVRRFWRAAGMEWGGRGVLWSAGGHSLECEGDHRAISKLAEVRTSQLTETQSQLSRHPRMSPR